MRPPPPHSATAATSLAGNAWGRWTATHETYGPERTALEQGGEAVMTWSGKGRLMRAIDRTFEAPAARETA